MTPNPPICIREANPALHPLLTGATQVTSRRTFLNRAIGGGIAAANFITTIGCSKSPEKPFRVATLPWPGYESMHLALSLGYISDAHIRSVEMTSANQSSAALRNGTVDAAMLTLDEGLFLMQDNVDIKAVLIMDVSNGADVAMARPEIVKLEDLREKRIGVEPGAIGAVMFDALLRFAGLSVGDVQLVPMPVNEHSNAYKEGKIDAVVTFDPERTKLLEQGARTLFDSSRIPDRIYDILFVRTAALKAHRQSIANLVASHFKALEYIKTHPEDTAVRLAPFLGVSTNLVTQQFEGLKLPSLEENRAQMSGTTPLLEQRARELVETMLRHKLMHKGVKVDQLIDPSFLPTTLQ